MKHRIRKTAKITLGVLLLAFGVVGLFLPVLQGVLLLGAGLSLLSTESPRTKAWLEYIQELARLRKRQTSRHE